MELGVRKRNKTMEIGQRDAPLLPLKMEEGGYEPRHVGSLSKVEKARRDSSLDFRKECIPADTFI